MTHRRAIRVCRVSILVFLDVALRQGEQKQDDIIIAVSILVFLDVALRQRAFLLLNG